MERCLAGEEDVCDIVLVLDEEGVAEQAARGELNGVDAQTAGVVESEDEKRAPWVRLNEVVLQ